jgi:hypothetical protein
MPSSDSWLPRVEIVEIIRHCLDRLEALDYKGYDPADFLNTRRARLKLLPQGLVRLLTILNFYSPINLRGIFRIPPAENTTAMAVLATALLRLHLLDADEGCVHRVRHLIHWLIQHALDLDGTLGWSRAIEFRSKRDVIHSRQSTMTFINALVVELLLDAYQAIGDDLYRHRANQACQHLLYHTQRIDYGFGTCLSYTNDSRLEIPNASALAGRALNRMYLLTGDSDYLALSLRILHYTLSRQNPDGSWYYSYDAQQRPKKQIDFHQCYMLDAIKGYRCVPDRALQRRAASAFERGTRFYIERQFDSHMRPYWRRPIKYPIDIHNISHGIYFLSKYIALFPEYRPRLMTLVQFCISSFYDRTGNFFYYQKYPFFTVRHDLFRWNTAWTLLALAEFLPLTRHA